ncbi:hypothetical protein Ancab_030036 [Ancistrocladus abbreviatus]
MALWSIWCSRNKQVLKAVHESMTVIKDRATGLLGEYHAAFSSRLCTPQKKWKPPLVGTFKMNVNVACIPDWWSMPVAGGRRMWHAQTLSRRLWSFGLVFKQHGTWPYFFYQWSWSRNGDNDLNQTMQLGIDLALEIS